MKSLKHGICCQLNGLMQDGRKLLFWVIFFSFKSACKFLQTSQKKYQGIFYCLIEKHMQNFRHFWRKKKFSRKSHFNALKCNLTELTTKSACVPLEVSGVNTCAHVSEFHVLVDRSIAQRGVRTGGILLRSIVWQLIAQAVLLSPLSLPLFPVPLLRGGSWLGCQVLPAMGAVFI